MKKTISLFLVFVFILSVMAPVSAQATNQPTPRYSYIVSLNGNIAIDSTPAASCSGSVTAGSYLPVKVVVELQIYEGGQWVTLKTWTQTGTMVASVNASYNLEYGNHYRVYVTGYVYDNNGNLLESASLSDAEYCPWPLRSLD